MATRKPKASTKSKAVKPAVLPKTYPHVIIGTHLTVVEYEDGTYEMIWDDDQLLKEVQEAIASVQ